MNEQKTVFINGGSRGIGAAMVRLFSEAGYAVAFSYLHSKSEAMALEEACGALAVRADSSCPEDIEAAVAFAEEHLGKIDVLINNAAISFIKLYTDVLDREWDKMLATNLKGPEKYIRSVLPGMISRKSGKIINISSMWGQVGASCEVHYSATKAALIGLSKALAKELGPSGITVNVIAPGLIETDMNGSLTKEDRLALCEETPLGRIGTPSDVARCALFLAGEGGDFMTGQVIAPNGGYVM